MNRGDALPCRCPKCRSADLVVFEEFIVMDAYHIEAGRLTDRTGDTLPNMTGAAFGRCNRASCGHEWRFRANPIQAHENSKL